MWIWHYSCTVSHTKLFSDFVMTNIIGGNLSNLGNAGTPLDSIFAKEMGSGSELDFLKLIHVALNNEKTNENLSDFDAGKILAAMDKSLGFSESNQPIKNKKSQSGSVDVFAISSNLISTLKSLPDDSFVADLDSKIGVTASRLLGKVISNNEKTKVSEKLSNFPQELQIMIDELDSLAVLKGFISDHVNFDGNASLSVKLTDHLSNYTTNIKNEKPSTGVPGLLLNEQFLTSEIEDKKDIPLGGEYLNYPMIKLNAGSFNFFEENPVLVDIQNLEETQPFDLETLRVDEVFLNTDIPASSELSDLKTIELKIKIDSETVQTWVSSIDGTKKPIMQTAVPIDRNALLSDDVDALNSLLLDIPKDDLAAFFLNVELKRGPNAELQAPKIYIKLSDLGKTLSTSSEKNSAITNVTPFQNIKPVQISDQDFKEIFTFGSEKSKTKLDAAQSNAATSLGEEDGKFQQSKLNPSELKMQNGRVVLEFFAENKIPASISSELVENFRERIQQVVRSLQQEMGIKAETLNFIQKINSKRSVEEALTNVAGFKSDVIAKLNSKKKLLMSTSDVISYRRDISTGKYNQKSFSNILLNTPSANESEASNGNLKLNNLFENLTDDLNAFQQKTIAVEKINLANTGLFKSGQNVTNSNIVTSNVSSTTLSVLDVQFASRLATHLIEQAINAKENFDLILEPENFGRVRVNVSLENLQLDVKLTAENSVSLAILRSSESILQGIIEMNGLKLAEYNVEMNSSGHNNEGSKEQKEHGEENKANRSESSENLDENLENTIDEGSHSLNLIA
jgi:hypothetical protein